MSRTTAVLAGAAALTLALSSCAGSAQPGDTPARQIVIGSPQFPEGNIVAEIYVGALREAGYDVEHRDSVGSREVLYGQLEQCNLGVVPEYTAPLLAFLDPDTATTGEDETIREIQSRLPASLKLLEASDAANNNAIVVTRATADKHNLKRIGDLAPVAGAFVFGGPGPFKTRAGGIPTIAEEYGVDFAEYRVLDVGGPITVSSLLKGDVDAGLLFTTDASIIRNDFVALDDPKDVLGTANIVPLVCKDAVDGGARAALDAVSAQLTTEELANMNDRYVNQHEDAEQIAVDWLSEHGEG